MNVISNINLDTPIGKLELSAKATNDITDTQFEILVRNYEVSSKKELDNVLNIVQKYRPEIYKKFETELKEL